MPLPTPKQGESQEEFMGRCLNSEAMNEFSSHKQKLAVCLNQYRRKKKSFDKSINFNVYAPIRKSWVETIKIDGQEKEQTFFEAVISGLKPDRDDEMMAQSAIDGMIMQLKSGNVPLFPDHGRDPITGERVYSWKQIMGVWVDGRQEGHNLVAVARLNDAHPDAELFKAYLKEGMPVGFSIGGRAIKTTEIDVEEDEIQ